MAKILVAYYSRTGHTEKMAQLVIEGVKKENVEVDLKKIGDFPVKELLDYDGIIIGSPCYYGAPAAEVKKLFDDSVKFHGKLDGKVGGAFTSSGNLAGGNETTTLDILHMMLVHGMIIQGDPKGSHYGAVAVGKPDERATKECQKLGQRIARLVKK